MNINEDAYPIEYFWEDELTEQETMRSTGLPIVSVGKPVWWQENDVMGQKWKSPNLDHKYLLVRFVFSLRPNKRHSIRKVEFEVYFYSTMEGSSPIVFDIYPKRLVEEDTGELSVGVGPDFKFLSTEVSLASIETKINLRQSVPVISANGLGESQARWVFSAHPAYPLTGSQTVFAILEIPKLLRDCRASIRLEAEILDKHFGLLRGVLAYIQKEHLGFHIQL